MESPIRFDPKLRGTSHSEEKVQEQGDDSVVHLQTMSRDSRVQLVCDTVAAGVPPTIHIRAVSSRKIARENLKVALAVRKELLKERTQLKADLAKRRLPVSQRMKAAVGLKEVEEKLRHINAKVRVYRQDARSPGLRKLHTAKGQVGPGIGLSRRLYRVVDTIRLLAARPSSQGAKSIVAGVGLLSDLLDFAKASKRLMAGYLDRRVYEQLLAAAEDALERGDLTHDERLAISEGAALVRERLERISLRGDFGWSIASGMRLTRSIVSFVTKLIKMTNQIPVGNLAGTVGSAITLPLATLLSLDGLWAVKNNLRQARADYQAVEGIHRGRIGLAQQELIHLDDILKMAGLEESGIKAQAVAVNDLIKESQQKLREAEARLIDGNLSPEEIRSLRQAKTYHSAMIGHYLVTIVDLVRGNPNLTDVLEVLQAKQVASMGLRSMDATLAPYLEQKLKRKMALELVLGVGETLNLISCGFQGVGLVTSFAHGAGVPLLTVGVVLGTVSMGVVYGGSMLVKKIRNMQLGADRVKGKDFEGALFDQLSREVEHWEAMKKSGLAESSTIALLFPLIREHYTGLPRDWTAYDWAKAVVEDSPGGVEREALRSAMSKMLRHDAGRGAVGSLIGTIVDRWRRQ